VRTSGDTSATTAAIPQLAAQIDSNVRTSTKTFEQALKAQLAPSRTIALLVAILGLLAMVLAVVGISGMVAYDASQRTREIGVRTALGALPRDIIALLLRQGVKLALIGLAVGIALAAGASQLLSAASLLFGVSSLDPATYLTTAIILAGVTMLACYIPARRATRIDPMAALRNR
jgi:putative ABC transport system permease protein